MSTTFMYYILLYGSTYYITFATNTGCVISMEAAISRYRIVSRFAHLGTSVHLARFARTAVICQIPTESDTIHVGQVMKYLHHFSANTSGEDICDTYINLFKSSKNVG